MFQDLDYYLECIPSIPMDEYGIWSSFLDILDFVKAEVDSLGNYAYDQEETSEFKKELLRCSLLKCTK